MKARPRHADTVYRLRITTRIAALMDICRTHRRLPRLSVLAEELGACERTIRRDLQALELARVKVPPRTWEASL